MRFKTVTLFLVTVLLLIGAVIACDNDDDDSSPGNDDDDDDNNDDDNDDDDNDDDDNDDDDNDDNDTPGPYYEDFLTFWQIMDEGYAYFIEKEVDWDAVRAVYEPFAFPEDDRREFELLIAEMTALLHDSHTWAYHASTGEQPTGVCLERLGDDIYVSRAPEYAAGLQLGDRVLTLDGADPDDLLLEAVRYQGCSSAQCCDYYRLAHVDAYAAGTDEVVYEVERDGDVLELAVPRLGSSTSVCSAQPLVDFLEDAAGYVLRYKPIDTDLGYIRLQTLSDGYQQSILEDLDAAMAAFADRDGIVFDARYNTGG
ncbi:MAG: hypothetical protein P9L99_18375 [Candidatus Lernaella stagnicola]|nr:hypothetical protein [Candidatus Lernaella stagnicola]